MRSCRRGQSSSWKRLLTTTRQYATQTGNSVSKAKTFCINTLQKHDLPSYLVKGFVPPQARDAFIALHALNIEIARVADSTSHAAVGAIRMQYWRDAIDKSLAGNPPNEPIAILLAGVAEDLEQRSNGHSRLSKTWLHRLINTREQYLDNRPYSSLSALEDYAEKTYSTLSYLILSAIPLQSLNVDHLASHIGKATGIVSVLRGIPLVAFPPNAPMHHPSRSSPGALHNAPAGAVLLPLDVMAQTGLQEEAVLRQGSAAPHLKDAIFEVATRANDHLITAREMLKNLKAGRDAGHEFEHANDADNGHLTDQLGTTNPRNEVEQAFGLLLQSTSTSIWLQRLEKVDFDIFNRSLLKTDWRLPWKLYWNHARRRL